MDQDPASAPSNEKEADSTREQIGKYSNFSVSESLGIPLLSKDSAPASWLGMPTPKSPSPQIPFPKIPFPKISLFDGLDVSMFDNGGKSYFFWLTDTDKKMIYAAAAVILLPLLGGFLFSR